MTTIWTSPRSITQYAEHESHIAWNTDNFDKVITLNGGVSLSAPLLHISRQPKNDILMKTWYIVASDFNFTSIPEQISGIEFRFTVDRSGRVFDDTVQLSLDNELIGENKCSRTVDPIQVYGGISDTWNVSDLSNIIQDPSFGITIRLKSHPSWPHKTTPILRGLELQIY